MGRIFQLTYTWNNYDPKLKLTFHQQQYFVHPKHWLQFLKDDQNDSTLNIENKDFHIVPSIKKDLDMIDRKRLLRLEIKDSIDHTKINYYYNQLIGTIICKWCKGKIITYV